MTPRSYAAAALGVLLSGCGYKGPLTLPEKTAPVVIRPAPSAQTAAPGQEEIPSATPTPPTESPESKPATPPPPWSTSPTAPPPATEGTPTGG